MEKRSEVRAAGILSVLELVRSLEERRGILLAQVVKGKTR